MGYNYYILIRGFDKENKINILSYGSYCGSYSSVHSHYLYNKMNQSTYRISYDGEEKMGEYCCVISFYDIEQDYNSCYHCVDFEKEIINILRLSTDPIEKIHNLKQYIDNLVINDKFDGLALEELISYYSTCKKYENVGYTNIEILYGIDP